MVPTTLAAWTIETIERLVAVGIFESRSFDFKEWMPRGADEPGKARLKKTVAAFANETGGFLVFGVKDDRTLPVKDRIVGVPPDCDVPALFGAQAARCTPAVQWDQLNPPHKTHKWQLRPCHRDSRGEQQASRNLRRRALDLSEPH